MLGGLNMVAISRPGVKWDPSVLDLSFWVRADYQGSPYAPPIQSVGTTGFAWYGTPSAGTSGDIASARRTRQLSTSTTVNVVEGRQGFRMIDRDATDDKLYFGSSLTNYMSSTTGSGWALVRGTSWDNGNSDYTTNPAIMKSTSNSYFGIIWTSSAMRGTILDTSSTRRNFSFTTGTFTNKWLLLQWKLDHSGAGTFQGRINRAAWSSSTSFEIHSTGMSTSVGLTIGSTTDGQQWGGQMLEAAVSSTLIDDADFDRIVQYCEERYGLNLTSI